MGKVGRRREADDGDQVTVVRADKLDTRTSAHTHSMIYGTFARPLLEGEAQLGEICDALLSERNYSIIMLMSL